VIFPYAIAWLFEPASSSLELFEITSGTTGGGWGNFLKFLQLLSNRLKVPYCLIQIVSYFTTLFTLPSNA
jgi:hypothetical protein